MVKLKTRRDDIAARMGHPPRRPRWPFAAGLIVVGVAGWAAARNEMLRTRLVTQARALAERISDVRSARQDRDSPVRSDPVAFTAAEPMPIETAAYADATTMEATDYPPGLGSDTQGVLGEPEAVTPA